MRQNKTFYFAGLGTILFLILVCVIIYKPPSREISDGQNSIIEPVQQSNTSTAINNSKPADSNSTAKASDNKLYTHHFPGVEKMTPAQLLNLGRQFAEQENIQAVQRIFGKSLLRCFLFPNSWRYHSFVH